MVKEVQTTEGVILRTFPFRDHHQILTLFTPDQGLIKLIYKGSGKKKGLQTRPIALSRVEVCYKENRNSELLSCEDIHLLESFQSLRTELARLEAACDLLHVLYTSQLVGRPSSLLYQLLIFYLTKLPQASDPWVISSSFRLKILHYEGYLSFEESELMFFDKKEQPLVEALALCQHFTQISPLILPIGFHNKIKNFFDERMGPRI